MVPADSRRIPRAPRYSGYRYASAGFAYVSVTLCGQPFQTVPLASFHAMSRSYNPGHAVTWPVWALPRSLATTGGIIVYFLFLRVLRCFSSPRWPLHKQMSCLQHDGLSHSEIGGSKVICTSPGLFAAYHVLHRLSEPRHPPSALIYFLTIVDRTNKYIRLSFAHTFSFLFVVRSLELLFYSLACVNMSKIFSGTCPGVENNGFEPLTPCLQSRCSSQLS